MSGWGNAVSPPPPGGAATFQRPWRRSGRAAGSVCGRRGRKCLCERGAKMAADVEAKGFEHMGLDGRLLRVRGERGP